MKRTITLLAAMTLLCFPAGLMAADYAHNLDAGDMTLSWTLEADKINFKLSAKTKGWVAIGIDPEKAMGGADIIIGAVKKGKFKIEDHFADKRLSHSPDKKLGGVNNVMNPGASEADGVTTLTFSLALTPAEKWDKPINAQGITRIMLAYGSRDSLKLGHTFRTVYDIDFATGKADKIK